VFRSPASRSAISCRSAGCPNSVGSRFHCCNPIGWCPADGGCQGGSAWRGDSQTRRHATPQNNRLNRVFEALDALGIHAEPAVYSDDFARELREQLLKLDGVLVWVDPISNGRDRTILDAMLRDVASKGILVSAHPDVILKMGVKQVLHRTKHLGWGSDTYLYRSVRAFREEFPLRLQSAGPRVLKQNRGNGGEGVWKIELLSPSARATAIVRILHARRRSVPEDNAAC
jgi:hypothetical protein